VALARLALTRWPLDGASDHLVSEALYLSDPDGNGIELYRDRPRSEWRWQDGQLQMATLALDLDGLLEELGPEPLAGGGAELATVTSSGIAPGTVMGHVHLQVADLAAAERFYVDGLGLDVTVRGYPGALFVSAGGYHHHLGLNTWHSRGAAPAAPGSVGLQWYELMLDGEAALSQALARLDAGGFTVEPAPPSVPAGALARDPSGNHALLRSA
jgi:catechol 2,3-dioxygenase